MSKGCCWKCGGMGNSEAWMMEFFKYALWLQPFDSPDIYDPQIVFESPVVLGGIQTGPA